MSQYSIGVDYGTNSVRALLVDCADGREVATAICNYPSGNAGIIESSSDVHLARQHPGDYIDGLHAVVSEVIAASGVSNDAIVGVGVDTTGSSPLPIAADGEALGMKPEFRENPHAQCWLWRDHTGYAETEEIKEMARKMDRPFLRKTGGTYSSEWWWSKILRCARVAPDVFAAADSWVELQDFIPGYLTGKRTGAEIPRGICAAGHKALYHRDWGGLPDKEFLAALDPRLADLRGRLYQDTMTSDQVAGTVTESVAALTGLRAGTPVAVGAFDAHMGAVGSGVKPGTLVKIMGTSTCDIMVGGDDIPDIPGVCGIVPGSVIPGMMGIEAGQSAVGDLFNWPVKHLTGGTLGHAELAAAASKLRPGESGLLALDWNNGNRTVLVDAQLTGLLVGQTLHTTVAEIYRAMIEATAFGALKIIQRIEEYGVPIQEIVVCGGIAAKSPLAMQIYADVCNRPIKLSRSEQTCALGAAIFGSVAGGAYADTLSAIEAMTGVSDTVYRPDPLASSTYARLFGLYSDLHDSFGKTGRYADLSEVMKELIRVSSEVRGAR